MNCETIKKNVNIRTVLESFNLLPAKENQRTAFYFALDREEKIPSLSVDYVKNKAVDFETGKSYDVISIVQQINKCSVSDALNYLKKFDLSVLEKERIKAIDYSTYYEIIEARDVRHPALVQYLKSRKGL